MIAVANEVRLHNFSVGERQAFRHSWNPSSGVGRWSGWAAYLADWALVREEAHIRRANHGRHRMSSAPFFADEVAGLVAQDGIAILETDSALDYLARLRRRLVGPEDDEDGLVFWYPMPI